MGSGGSKAVEVEEEISAFTKEEEWRNDQGLQVTPEKEPAQPSLPVMPFAALPLRRHRHRLTSCV